MADEDRSDDIAGAADALRLLDAETLVERGSPLSRAREREEP